MKLSWYLQLSVVYGIVFACTGNATPPVKLTGDISTIIFDTMQNYYRVDGDIEIPSGKNVLIPAGTVLLFNFDVVFRINGSCTIDGTTNKPVVLSSLNDTLFTKTAAAPSSPFDWKGIIIGETAKTVTFRNVQLKYAEHPLESVCPDLVLDRVYRIKTNDDFFILNGQKYYTTGNEPFYSPQPRSIPTSDSTAVPSAHTVKVIPKKPQTETKKNARWWQRKPVRWSIGATGGAALLSSGGCIIGYFVNQNIYNNERDIANPESDVSISRKRDAVENYRQARENMSNCLPIAIVSGIAGAVLMTGFGLTFYF